MIRTYGLTHVAIASKDPAKAASFYMNVFGCVIMYQQADFVQLQTPGTHDIIVLERNADAAGREGGFAHIGFRLQSPDDIDAAATAVLAAGGFVKEQGEFVPGEPYLFANDLDGNVVEIWFELPPSSK